MMRASCRRSWTAASSDPVVLPSEELAPFELHDGALDAVADQLARRIATGWSGKRQREGWSSSEQMS
jgi:hypothetical protein